MFDYVFDRGCFHVLPIERRPVYIREIKRILDDKGVLFLKCFSIKEPRQEGPYKFSETEIRQLFGNEFVIISVWKDNDATKKLFANSCMSEIVFK